MTRTLHIASLLLSYFLALFVIPYVYADDLPFDCHEAAALVANGGRMDSKLLSEWMAKASAGDEHAKQVVIAALTQQLPAIIRDTATRQRKRLSDEEVEDVQQAVLLSMVKGNFSYDVSKGQFSTWAFNIVRNEMLGRTRRKDSRFLRESDISGGHETDFLHHAPDTEAQDPAGEAARIVHSAIKLLPDHEAELIKKYDIAQASLGEVGEGMNVSGERVRQIRADILPKLKARMEGVAEGTLGNLADHIDLLTPEEKLVFLTVGLDGAVVSTVARENDLSPEAATQHFANAYRKLNEVGAIPNGLHTPANLITPTPATPIESKPAHAPKSEVQIAWEKTVVEFIAENGWAPRDDQRISALAPEGVSYRNLIGQAFNSRGERRGDAVYESPEAFKKGWDDARKREIARLLHKSQDGHLSAEEQIRLGNLRETEPIDTPDGMVAPRRPFDREIQTAEWQLEKPKGQASAARRIVDFIAEVGRLPYDKEEIKNISGFGYDRLTGQSKYRPGQLEEGMAVFTNKEAFKQAWTSYQQREIYRLREKERLEDITDVELRHLTNLEGVSASKLPDGIRNTERARVKDPEARFEYILAERARAQKAIVDHVAETGIIPTEDSKIAEITGIPVMRLTGLNKYGPRGPRRGYAIYDDPDNFNQATSAALNAEIGLLKAKGRKQRLTSEEQRRLKNLEDRTYSVGM